MNIYYFLGGLSAAFIIRGIPAALLPCYFFGIGLPILSIDFLNQYIPLSKFLPEHVYYPILFVIGMLTFFFMVFFVPSIIFFKLNPSATLNEFRSKFPDTLKEKNSPDRNIYFLSLLLIYFLIALQIALKTHIIFGTLTLTICIALMLLSYFFEK